MRENRHISYADEFQIIYVDTVFTEGEGISAHLFLVGQAE